MSLLLLYQNNLTLYKGASTHSGYSRRSAEKNSKKVILDRILIEDSEIVAIIELTLRNIL